jgi:hypothetical protein
VRWIAACSRGGGHVQHCSHCGPATPNSTLAPHSTAVSVKWSNTYEGSDLLVAQCPKFRQVCHQRGCEDGPNTWYGFEQVVSLSPQRTAPQQADQFAIGLLEARFQPGQVFVDLGTNARRDSGPTVALGSHHFDELAPASEQHTQRLRLRIGQWPHGWTDCIREVRQDAGVDCIGLGQFAGRLADARTWRGLTTCTGRPAAASAPTAATCSRAVASSTISAGRIARSRSTRAAMPTSSRMSSRSASAPFLLRGSIASLSLGPVGRPVYAWPEHPVSYAADESKGSQGWSARLKSQSAIRCYTLERNMCLGEAMATV